MATARQLITSALRLIGVVHKSEPITADEAQDALAVLNEMIESWANDSLLIYSRSWEDFQLTGGIGEYTMGIGGDFNTARPTQIISCYTQLPGSDISYPLQEITDDEYALEITQKDLSNNIPNYYNFDNGYPLAKIRIWQVPSTQMRLYMQSEKQVTSFPTLDTVIDLPPGWLKALRTSLAMDLAPEYDVEVTQRVAIMAAESKGLLKSQILKNRPLTFMPSSIGIGYSIYGDVYK